VDADVQNWTDEAVADAFGCHLNTVGNIRRRFVEGGLEAALARRKRHYQPRLVDGEVEAQIIALRCSAPPEGHASWTLRLLADKLGGIKSGTFYFPRDREKGSKKNQLRPHLKEYFRVDSQLIVFVVSFLQVC
jgi:transposase